MRRPHTARGGHPCSGLTDDGETKCHSCGLAADTAYGARSTTYDVFQLKCMQSTSVRVGVCIKRPVKYIVSFPLLGLERLAPASALPDVDLLLLSRPRLPSCVFRRCTLAHWHLPSGTFLPGGCWMVSTAAPSQLAFPSSPSRLPSFPFPHHPPRFCRSHPPPALSALSHMHSLLRI